MLPFSMVMWEFVKTLRDRTYYTRSIVYWVTDLREIKLVLVRVTEGVIWSKYIICIYCNITMKPLILYNYCILKTDSSCENLMSYFSTMDYLKRASVTFPYLWGFLFHHVISISLMYFCRDAFCHGVTYPRGSRQSWYTSCLDFQSLNLWAK
jgi:hypothetical protein